AGNQIDNPASFQIRTTRDKTGPDATLVTYDVWSVDPRVIAAMHAAGVVPGALPTADTVVKAAQAFASVYHDGTIPNTNLCNWIADNVAAAAGAPMPGMNSSLDPSLNEEGGFWRIVYASDIPNPVQDWSGLVQPGDIVRMGWFKPEAGRVSGHSTTVLSTLDSNGEIQFFDNNDNKHIGIHNSAYWLATDPEDITIYRIDPNQQYLIEGTDAAETIRGSVYDNLIRPGGGRDIIQAKLGDNEVEGTAAELDGIRMTYFNPGDSFHFTDIDANDAAVTYRGGRLHVFDGGDEVATIRLPKPDKGFSFIVTADSDGGSKIELGSAEIEVTGNGVVIPDEDKTPGIADGTGFGAVPVGDTVTRTFVVNNTGSAALDISKLVLPKGFVLVEGLSSTIAAGGSDSFEVQIVTRTEGFKSGTITIRTNDPDESVFRFAVNGLVTEAPSSGSAPVLLSGMASQFSVHDNEFGLGLDHRYDFDLV
ncbi:MAG: choice-of-anchor D domain-containing protein, partial [Pseudorhodoplanes sp.]